MQELLMIGTGKYFIAKWHIFFFIFSETTQVIMVPNVMG
jgi:hypothetical protein